jgi:uncharacterized protein YukE
MITMQGTIPFPPTADARPIQALAANLKQLSAGLAQGSSQLMSTASTAQSSWSGAAANSFTSHVNKRAKTVATIGKVLGTAAPVLQTFAAAIEATSTAYSTAATMEQAARAGLPWSAAALAAAIAAEAAALAALQGAGVACAGALAAIEAEIAVAEFTGVTREDFTRLKDTAAKVWESVSHMVNDGDTHAATAALTTTTEKPKSEAQQRGDEYAHLGEEIGHMWHLGEKAVGIVEGYGKGLGYAADHFATKYDLRGITRERWLPNRGGPSIGFTQVQAAERALTLERWAKVAKIPIVNGVVEGGLQALHDQKDLNLTTTQRVTRAGTAAVLQGAGAWAGATAGAQAGAAVGAGVGAFFGGVGAVPGALIGGILFGIGGGIAGSQVGQWAKEAIFDTNIGGAFR